MLLRVNPNRMELIRLRKRLLLAERGHKLLEDKLEELMRRFLVLLKDIDKAKEDFQKNTQDTLQSLLYCRITSPKETFEESLSKINSVISIEVSTRRIMNVKAPAFNILKFDMDKGYDLFKTSAQMDVVVAKARDFIQSLLRLAELFKTSDILSYEIERTRRRVNALEYLLIPAIKDTIRDITQKLNEFERGNLTRLMRVKEMVRAH